MDTTTGGAPMPHYDSKATSTACEHNNSSVVKMPLGYLASLLPADVNWSDPLTPSLLVEILAKHAAAQPAQGVGLTDGLFDAAKLVLDRYDELRGDRAPAAEFEILRHAILARHTAPTKHHASLNYITTFGDAALVDAVRNGRVSIRDAVAKLAAVAPKALDLGTLPLPDLRYHDEYRRGYAVAIDDVRAMLAAPQQPAASRAAVPEGLRDLLTDLYEFTKYAACSQRQNTSEFLSGLFEQIEALQPRCAAMLAAAPSPKAASVDTEKRHTTECQKCGGGTGQEHLCICGVVATGGVDTPKFRELAHAMMTAYDRLDSHSGQQFIAHITGLVEAARQEGYQLGPSPQEGKAVDGGPEPQQEKCVLRGSEHMPLCTDTCAVRGHCTWKGSAAEPVSAQQTSAQVDAEPGP